MEERAGLDASRGGRGRAGRNARGERTRERALSLGPIGRGTLPDRVADAIRRRLILGEVQPGRRIESLRTLAEQLGVSVSIVREAWAQLKGEGLIEVRHGVGAFVVRRPRAARVLRAARRRASRREAAELRRGMEPVAAAVAARKASERSLLDLRMALYERTRAAGWRNLEAFTDADLNLHLALFQAARNSIGVGAYRMAVAILRRDLLARAEDHRRDRYLHELHQRLVDAVEEGRQPAAYRAAAAIARIEARPP